MVLVFPMGLVWGKNLRVRDVLTFSNLRAEAHPTCSVCYIVRWDTDVLATSELEVKTRNSEWFVEQEFPSLYRSKELTQNHEVVILGLSITRSSEYVYRIRSVAEDGQVVQGRGVFTNESAGSSFFMPEISVDLYDPQKAYNGWTLFDFQTAGMPEEEEEARSNLGAMIVDMQGRVMWNSPQGNDIEMLDNGNLLRLGGFGVSEETLAGDIVWSVDFEGGEGHHDVDKVWDEEAQEYRVVVVQRDWYELPDGGVDGITHMQVDAVVEYNLAGDIVWSWRGLDYPEYIPYDRVDPTDLMRDPRHPARVDFTHMNTVILDKERGYCYFYLNYLHAFFKVRYDPGNFYADGTVKWILGDYPSFVDEVFEGALPLPFVELENGTMPYGAHDPEPGFVSIDGEERLQVLFLDNDVNHGGDDPGDDDMLLRYLYPSPPASYPWGGGGLLMGDDDDDDDDGFEKSYFLPLVGNEMVDPELFENENKPRSRAVEYRFISEGLNPVAEQIWEFNGSPNYPTFNTSGWGDADRLPNGNILISPGYSEYSDGEEEDERGGDEVFYGVIMEVTPEGEMVSRITMEEGISNYKFQRFRAPQLADNYLSLLTVKNGRQQFKLFEMPESRDGEMGELVALDRAVMENRTIRQGVSGDVDGDGEDEIILISEMVSDGRSNLVIYEVPDQVNGEMGPLRFNYSLDSLGSVLVGFELRGVSAGNFDGDLKDELVLLLKETSTGMQKVVIYDVLFGDESEGDLREVMGRSFWDVSVGEIQFIEVTDLEVEGVDKLVMIVVRGQNQQLAVYDLFSSSVMPEMVVNSVGKLSSNSVVLDVAVGDYEGDGRDELFFVRSNGLKKLLEVYELPLGDSNRLQKSTKKKYPLLGSNSHNVSESEELLGVGTVRQF